MTAAGALIQGDSGSWQPGALSTQDHKRSLTRPRGAVNRPRMSAEAGVVLQCCSRGKDQGLGVLSTKIVVYIFFSKGATP